MSKSPSFQSIESIGRSKLLQKLRSHLTTSRKEISQRYPGDSTLHHTGDKLAVTSNALFIEGVDFDLTYHPLQHLGHKWITAAVSDLYAMNAEPVGLNLEVAVSNKISVEMLELLMRGVNKACEDYNIAVAQLEIKASLAAVCLSAGAFGSVAENEVISRRGAKLDDAVCVSGDLGAAIAGLRILLREKKFWEQEQGQQFQPDLSEYEYVVQRQLMPKHRLDLIKKLKNLSIRPTAMTTVKNGLISELGSMADDSKVGFYLFQAALPIAIPTRQVADEMGQDVDKYALYGGEDYELVFTLPKEDVEELAEAFEDFAIVGKVVDREEGIGMQTAEGDYAQFQERI